MKSLGAGVLLGLSAGALMGIVEVADLFGVQGVPGLGAGARASLAAQILAATATAGGVLGFLLGGTGWLVSALRSGGSDLPERAARVNQALLDSHRRDWVISATITGITAAGVCVLLYTLSSGFLSYPIRADTLVRYAGATLLLGGLSFVTRLVLGPGRSRPGFIRFSTSTWTIIFLGLGIFCLLYLIDRNHYVHLYNSLHLAIAMGAFLALFASLISLCAGPGLRQTRFMKGAAIALPISWVCACLFALAQHHSNEAIKAALYNRTTYAKRIYPLLSGVIPAFRPRPLSLPAGGLAALAPEPAPWRGATPDYHGANLVLISIDAARADRLTPDAGARSVMPNLNRFAESALVFSEAYAQGSNTFPSISSLMIGRLPSEIHWTLGVGPPLSEENLTIAEILAAAGYDTAAVTPHRYFDQQWGLTQGFARHDNSLRVYNKDNRGIVSERIVNKTREMVAKLEIPFFLWVHFYDPHHYYMPRPINRFGERAVDLYDGEMAETDGEIGRLVDWLEANVKGATIITVTADHGEEFGDHGAQFHGTTLYDEVIHVPLLIRTPDLLIGEIKTPVSLLDLAPTFLDLLRIDAPDEMSGRSLGPLLLGTPSSMPAPPIFGEATQLASKKMVLYDGWKLIYDTDHDTWELYDLRSDPREKRNAYEFEPEKVKALKTLLLPRLRTPN